MEAMQRFTDHIVRTTYTDLPPAVRAATKTFILEDVEDVSALCRLLVP